MSTSAAPRWALSYVSRHVGEPTNWTPVHRRAVLFEVDGRAVLVWAPFFRRVRHSVLRITPRAQASAAAAPRPAPGARAQAFGVPAGSSAEAAEADVEEMLADGAYEVHGSKSAPLKSVSVGADGKPSPAAPASAIPSRATAGSAMPEVDDHTPEEPAHPRSPTSRYVGDATPVLAFEAIGAKAADRLKALGCTDTDQLGRFDPAELSAALGVPQRTVEDWQAMGELVKVKGIGRQTAEVLARSGVRGIQDLRSRSARSIASQAQRHLRSLPERPSGHDITENRVVAWKDAAKAVRRVPATVLHPKVAEAAPAAPAARPAAPGWSSWSDQKAEAAAPAKKDEVKPMRLGEEDLVVVRDRTARKAVTVRVAEEPKPEAEPAKPVAKPVQKPIDLDAVEVRAARSNPLLTKVKAQRAVIEDEKPAAQPERKTVVADGSSGPFGAIGGIEVKRDRKSAK